MMLAVASAFPRAALLLVSTSALVMESQPLFIVSVRDIDEIMPSMTIATASAIAAAIPNADASRVVPYGDPPNTAHSPIKASFR